MTGEHIIDRSGKHCIGERFAEPHPAMIGKSIVTVERETADPNRIACGGCGRGVTFAQRAQEIRAAVIQNRHNGGSDPFEVTRITDLYWCSVCCRRDDAEGKTVEACRAKFAEPTSFLGAFDPSIWRT